MRVLVVDDNDDLRRLHETFVRRLGHEARGAANCEQALVRLQVWPPDLVLLDIEIPLCDGYETAKLLRPWLGEATQIWAVTATHDDAQRRQQSRVDGYVQKPLTRELLRQIIVQQTGRRARQANSGDKAQ